MSPVLNKIKFSAYVTNFSAIYSNRSLIIYFLHIKKIVFCCCCWYYNLKKVNNLLVGDIQFVVLHKWHAKFDLTTTKGEKNTKHSTNV